MAAASLFGRRIFGFCNLSPQSILLSSANHGRSSQSILQTCGRSFSQGHRYSRAINCRRTPQLCCPSQPAAFSTRHFSSPGSEEGPSKPEKPENKPSPTVQVIGVPSPLRWIRNKVYFWLIQIYFDPEFTYGGFISGAKQALVVISEKLSQCNFEGLDQLISKEALPTVQDKCTSLSLSQRESLRVDKEDIMITFPQDVAIYYDEGGRKFVDVMVRFWFLSKARWHPMEDDPEGIKIFKVPRIEGMDGREEDKKILTCNYEFHREFTPGVTADWTVTKVQHWKLLE
ncbi:MAIP1 [Branchiostoma lanceolatum]|uniref:MAIP1 protein n=1 Tax=Branchiostoma lanceolatum TaxID=7740 RepID=A0A8J9Z7V6_BRALA|nr:MAIP1 [Branchiostoma lanceolatum]